MPKSRRSRIWPRLCWAVTVWKSTVSVYRISRESAKIRGGMECSSTPSCPKHGVDPDVADGAGYTVLHHLASDYCRASNEERVIRATMLLDAGAALTIRDSLLKSTPLGWACRWGRIELVRLYLERGTDPVEVHAEAWTTPLAWAEKRGHMEIAELLRAYRR